MNKIHIRDLALRCIIGVFPEERTERQDILLNVTLTCDFGASARTDRLEDTVDYKRLTKQIITVVEGSEFQLLEALAERVAGICLETPRVRRATVCIDKPGALRFARSVAVEVTRVAAD
jgi:D-erythro-7,8-dihydroneopterin triphosphate epimerase